MGPLVGRSRAGNPGLFDAVQKEPYRGKVVAEREVIPPLARLEGDILL